MDEGLNAFIDKLDGTKSVSEAREILARTLADMGFKRFAYLGLHLPDTTLAEPVLVHAYPEEWHTRYISQNYAAVDPVVQTGLRSLVPFVWGDKKQLKDMDRKSREMMNEASEFNLTRGFTVPIHGARGELAALSVALPSEEGEAFKHIASFQHQIHLMALYFHASMGETIFADSAKKHTTLSKRESECLLWACEGKTAWETSEILKISEHTVREYIKNSCKKLGVYSKNHAIVKSIILGLIRPNL